MVLTTKKPDLSNPVTVHLDLFNASIFNTSIFNSWIIQCLLDVTRDSKETVVSKPGFFGGVYKSGLKSGLKAWS